jgi:hypothetical protein
VLVVCAATITIKLPTAGVKPAIDLVPLAVVNTDPKRDMLGEAKFYALSAVYVSEEQETVSPAATVKPPVILISAPEEYTEQWIIYVPPEV